MISDDIKNYFKSKGLLECLIIDDEKNTIKGLNDTLVVGFGKTNIAYIRLEILGEKYLFTVKWNGEKFELEKNSKIIRFDINKFYECLREPFTSVNLSILDAFGLNKVQISFDN